VRIDAAAVMRRIHHVVGAGRSHYERVLAADENIRLVRACARFSAGRLVWGGDSIRVGDVPIVIATGARPRIPLVDGITDTPFLTNESLLALRRLPRSLVVVGAGPVGIELAHALARLDVEVTLLTHGEPLAGEEPEARDTARRVLERDGVRLLTNVRLRGLAPARRGVRVAIDHEAVTADAVLVATGREPSVSTLEPAAAGIELDRGGIAVSPYLETSAPGVWALGDAIGGAHVRHQYTHVATYEGPLVAENALSGSRHRPSYAAVPRVTFTDPEVAAVGLTETDARSAGHTVATRVKHIREVGKARAMGEDEGFVKLVLDRVSGALVGATIVAAHAGDMLAEVTIPMHVAGAGLEPLLATIHAHPTLSEAVKVAARDAARLLVDEPLGTKAAVPAR
jgi:pyruvate/2-oxoglutarate dehydrogenase complex dihydrolipoamide dehydrogenase (E3) component